MSLFKISTFRSHLSKALILNSITKRFAISAMPSVIEYSGMGDSYEVYSKLLKERIICLRGPICDISSSLIVAQLLYLQSQSAYRPIDMYINSPGGSATAGLGIYDTMQYIHPPVATWCVGRAYSMASLLLAAGSPGMRYAFPNSRIMIDQPSGAVKGQASQMQIYAHEMVRLRDILSNLYAKHTGLPVKQIEANIERMKFMSAHEACEHKLIDMVKTPSPPKIIQQTSTIANKLILPFYLKRA